MFIDEFFSYLISTNQIDKIVPKENKEEQEKEKQKVKSKNNDKKSSK